MKFMKTFVITIALVCGLLSTSADASGCLTQNVYHEARNQPILGQIAVAWVTKNRRDDPRYPNDLCRVVYHKNPGADVYQFSWLNDIDKLPEYKNKDAKAIAESIAIAVWNDFIPDPTYGATHYHSTKVHPKWANSPRMVFLRKIGDHLFYRWMTRAQWSENKQLFTMNDR